MNDSTRPLISVSLLRRLKDSRYGDRSGVALILVIGLLALMMVMGVTFSIFMRTERTAAGSFRNGVVTRQLLHVALNRALVALDTDPGPLSYPPWAFLESGSTNGTPVATPTSSPILDWVPRATLIGAGSPQPRWIEGLPGEGRVAFLAINCSGLIDANLGRGRVGLARANGTDPREIQVGSLPDVRNALDLLANPVPYESMQDLAIAGLDQGILSGPVSNLVNFSACPPGRWDPRAGAVATNMVDIGGSWADLTNLVRAADIKAGLISSLQVSPADADFIYLNLLDYVDPDCVPGNLASPCTESVPMINEVKATTQLNFEGSNCTPFVVIDMEWFYPFARPNAGSFRIERDITIAPVQNSDPAFVVPPRITGEMSADYDRQVNYAHTVQEIAEGNTVVYPSRAGNTVSFRVTVKLRMKQADGQVVDEVPSPWNDAQAIVITTPPVRIPAFSFDNENSPLQGASGVECIDPRFNWDGRDGEGQWIRYDDDQAVDGWQPAWTNGSLNMVNNFAAAYWRGNDCDQHPYCYVADRPLTVVGELSYLLRGAGLENRWTTIRLYDERDAWQSDRPIRRLDPVLDYFVVGNPTVVRKGLINPNTQQPDVVRAALINMPLDEYPGMPNPVALGDARSGAMLTALTNWWVSNDGLSGNVTNLSDIGHATGFMNLQAVTDQNLTPFQREAFYRNLSGLLGVRQQYFVILLYAQMTKTVPQVGMVEVDKVRGIAEVWRDAYTQQRFVRLQRPINEH